MFQKVSVDEAIKIGRIKINIISGIIFLVVFVLFIFLGLYISKFYFVLSGIITGSFCAILYRAIMLIKWRLWAFENVRNVHELKQKALVLNLIFEKDSFLKRFEFISTADMEQWELLQAKFNIPDIFIDDYSIPAETIIFYSMFKKIAWIILFIFILGLGFYLIYMGAKISEYIAGGFLILVSTWMIYVCAKNVLDRRPQIILKNVGLSTIATKFYKWDDVSGERTERQGYGKSIRHYLLYDCPDSKKSLHLDDFAISSKRLAYLLKIYRSRHVNSSIKR